eukprot:2331872-Rhodomonas_salina.3
MAAADVEGGGGGGEGGGGGGEGEQQWMYSTGEEEGLYGPFSVTSLRGTDLSSALHAWYAQPGTDLGTALRAWYAQPGSDLGRGLRQCWRCWCGCRPVTFSGPRVTSS